MAEFNPNQPESEQALYARARSWANGDPDPASRAELENLIDGRNAAELRERMLGELEFGTAGLRGVVAAGSARMNLAVVIRITRALAEHLLARIPDARARPVVVAADARLDSARFADAAARVLIAVGIPVRRFTEPVPTPLLSYAVGAFAASAGVMITASHNGPEYNGYKLYAESGVQVIAPDDAEISERRRALGPANAVPLGDWARQEFVSPRFADRYLADVRAQMPRTDADRAGGSSRALRIVYTPLHGVGAALAERLLSEAGYANVHSVPEQREPDGRFPTVPFPNPEQPGALDLAMAQARASKADLLIANDPDADRLAVALPMPSGRFLPLTGNQVGLLLADFALRHFAQEARSLVVASLVSSPMLDGIAAAYGARCERVLTGFKWVWTAALALEAQGYCYCFAYEEALGYAFGRAVHDKDGISAALAFAELCAEARAVGKSAWDSLHALYRRHGLWVSVQHNVALAGSTGAARIMQAMNHVLQCPPSELAGHEVHVVRDLRVVEPAAPVWRGPTLLVELRFGDHGRAFVRPSGTEPKLKIYVDWRGDFGDTQSLSAAESEALATAHDIAQALVTALDLAET